nr:helix-turn-helix transcriptional regulator [Actinomyces qiguomingii]
MTGQGVDFLAEDADERAVYVISVAAELAGMHPQTLRQYDRLGLVTPARASGRGRRYSHRDVQRLRRVQMLSQEGVNLEGIRRILDLERRLERLEEENRALRARQEAVERVFAAAADGEVQVLPVPSGRRARSRRGAGGGPAGSAADAGDAVSATQRRPGTAIVVRHSWPGGRVPGF